MQANKKQQLQIQIMRGPKQGELITIDSFPAILGRGKDCDYKFDAMGISRSHCIIEKAIHGFTIQDLQSANGTFLNGYRILTASKISNDDLITIGPVSIRMHISDKISQRRSATNVEQRGVLVRRAINKVTCMLGVDAQEEDTVLTPTQEKLQHSYRSLKTFYEVVETCNNLSDNLPCENLLDSIYKTIHATRGAIVLKNQEQNYEPAAFIVNGHRHHGFHISQTILKDVLENGVSIICYDIEGSSRYSHSDSLRMQNVETILCVPLVSRKKVFGAVYLDRIIGGSGTMFTEEDLELMAAIGIQVGSALEKSLLLEKIRSSLAEKEILLKEIHHRVKNNLQVISSLLNLQAGYLQDSQSIETFQELQNRIYSMSLIHEKLYLSDDLAWIDFAEYVPDLAMNLFHTYEVNSELIRVKFDIPSILLGIDYAVPCGLIINELFSNALKYAFPENRTGEICVSLQTQNDMLALIISDNGIGFPENVDYQNTESLGMQLVITLVQQIKGTVHLTRNHGSKFTIHFARLPSGDNSSHP